jgi:hypothetical protein
VTDKRNMKRSDAGKKMVLIAGTRPQMRKATQRSWTRAKEEVFLMTLAETCNVTRACEAAEVGVTSVYRRKKENASFRANWLAAIAIAYQRLELALLERAFNGTEKLVKVGAGDFKVMREYSTALGVALLKMHRDAAIDAGFEIPAEEIEEVRQRLMNKLRRMDERDGRNGAPDA